MTKTVSIMTTKNGNNSVFPIYNASACVFKWGWNTLRLYNGKSSSCHRVTPVEVTPETFDSFHNTPEVLDDRRRMLQGQWPVSGRGCEYCRDIEQAGGISDRLHHNQISGLTPVDFATDNLNATPRISEIYLNNTCDLACVYCLPVFSSKINQELKKFGPYPLGIESVNKSPDRDRLFSLYLNWLKNNGSKLSRLSILGGEPLLQNELWQILEILYSLDNKNLELAINTNLNCNAETLQRFIDIGRDLTVKRKIKQVHVCASLDCWGDQAEFVRYGLNLQNWQRNFESLMQHRWMALSVHQVITSLTMKTAIDLQQRIAEYKKTNPKILQDYHLVDSGLEKIYHPQIFGGDFFQYQFDQLITEFPITTDWDIESRKRLEGIAGLTATGTVEIDRLHMLKQTLDTIDQRRGTDWQKLWPEISQYFIENNI